MLAAILCFENFYIAMHWLPFNIQKSFDGYSNFLRNTFPKAILFLKMFTSVITQVSRKALKKSFWPPFLKI
jgi:hypothetical protein